MNRPKSGLPGKKNIENSLKGGEFCRGEYTTSQILKHNVPLLCMYVLGTILVALYDPIFGIVYILYLVLSLMVFTVLICAYCPHYGSRTSLCGYGLLARYLTKHKPPREFKDQFRRFIGVLFPVWFVPLIVGVVMIIFSFDWLVLILLIIFIILAFGVVLYISRTESCKTCKLRHQCPWNGICSRF